jgi:DNA uptake protein ComE-like DNA-binding protein
MSSIESDRWFSQTPLWVKLSWIPLLGNGALIWAGLKAKNPLLTIIGGALFAGFGGIFLTNLYQFIQYIYILQVVIAYSFKTDFLIRTFPDHLALPSDTGLAQKVISWRGKIDINSCSKDDLVRGLGISLIYANDIFVLRESGHIFTHAEELTEMIGIPESTVNRIKSVITFSYNQMQESYVSWRRANNLSLAELTMIGLELPVAEAIIRERNRGGQYKSIVDITKRTGLPVNSFRPLI